MILKKYQYLGMYISNQLFVNKIGLDNITDMKGNDKFIPK